MDKSRRRALVGSALNRLWSGRTPLDDLCDAHDVVASWSGDVLELRGTPSALDRIEYHL
jgi:hypothetical protein